VSCPQVTGINFWESEEGNVGPTLFIFRLVEDNGLGFLHINFLLLKLSLATEHDDANATMAG